MNEIKEKNTKIFETIKLNKSYLNYREIIEKNLPYKFSYLDESLLKESRKLLVESNMFHDNKNIQCNYRIYPRGTIIKVDFGVNLGSEMSQVHFAIVLNNYDNNRNNVLTVLPLTSKKGKFNLNLGLLISEELINHVKQNMNKIGIMEEFDEEIIKDPVIQVKARQMLDLLKYYEKNLKNTYACCNLITTISKTRILFPINEYDIVGRKRCSSKILDIIDTEIAKLILKNY